MKPRHTILLVAILALPVAAGGDRIQSEPTPAAGPAFSQGQVLSLDASGKISPRAPQTSDLRDGLGAALSTSSEGLVEEKSPVSGGGVMVDLQGRFQNAMTLEQDANGNITSAPCIAGTPAEVK
jgi:hypothetical protein